MLHRRCCWEKRWQSASCETKNIPITRPSRGSHSRSLMAKPSPYKAIELERQAPRVGISFGRKNVIVTALGVRLTMTCGAVESEIAKEEGGHRETPKAAFSCRG